MGSGADGQLFLLHLLREYVETEKRLAIALTPALRGPLHAHKPDIRMRTEIEQNLVSTAVEFLREGHQGLGPPFLAIHRAPDRNVQTLLFDDAGNAEGQQDQTAFRSAKVQIGTVAVFANC